EKGIVLTRECQTRLTQAEQHVNRLLERNGELVMEPFETPDTDNN
ncbi:MAG TPA: exodeoxyribonuclease VII small subunit, partial [Cellvibrionaceae bacterium]